MDEEEGRGRGVSVKLEKARNIFHQKKIFLSLSKNYR